jgi:propanediol dehydratase medium subunit
MNDHMARPRWQAKAALLQLKETELVVAGRKPVEVEMDLHRAAG